MDYYIARQPIFDRERKVVGYELLYRENGENAYRGQDENISTMAVIRNAMLSNFHSLTEGKRGMINFPPDLIVEKYPLLFSPENLVVDLLNPEEGGRDWEEAVLEMGRKGFVFSMDAVKAEPADSEESPWQKQVKMVLQMDFLNTPPEEWMNLVRKGRVSGRQLMAKKIETQEDFDAATRLGFDYFQGYYFSRPVMLSGKDIQTIRVVYFQILDELAKESPDFKELSRIIEGDVGLSYKILKLINSVAFAGSTEIESIHQAVVRIGLDELRKWIIVLMMKDLSDGKSDELLQQSLVRANLMEAMADHLGLGSQKRIAFLTGLFSLQDVIMDRPMEEIMADLALKEEIKDAILGRTRLYRDMLRAIRLYENGEWEDYKEQILELGPVMPEMAMNYIKALEWARELVEQ